jgi:fumarate hydratase subunit alpha
MKIICLSEVRDKIKDLVQTANFELQDNVLDVIIDMESKKESLVLLLTL